ncbi:putative peptidyl-tRNA hydrolase PTRHD1 [Hypsibius exemplaris]|uniref:peptidyl-tRNA hydrolase n=1 Tax=Hypsibius exemplaris TaxID=2072580 RepID=A0A1W0X3Y9_HYPEX|nr:putative peptidyl-tRNA hydrolase PTRHD1 [Hypsibius exemplaris]
METRRGRSSCLFSERNNYFISSFLPDPVDFPPGKMEEGGKDQLIQYLILRGDLKWPVGSLVAQGAHAASAALHIFREDSQTQRFLADLDRMHVCVLKVPDEVALSSLADQLKEKDIGFKLWIEQPENVATCLATKPYMKSAVSSFFAHLKLFRGLHPVGFLPETSSTPSRSRLI